jgi:hypothetical protein
LTAQSAGNVYKFIIAYFRRVAVSAGFLRGTNTSLLKMECGPGKDEQDKPTATFDDMLLFLATHKTEKLAVINRAKNT